MSTIISSDKVTIQEPPIPLQQSRKRTSHYTLYVFFVLFLATLLNGLDASEFTSASTVIARELHLGINDIGILASAFTIFLTISIIPIGIWADRAKRSYVIAACLGVWSLATALTGLAGNMIALFLTRMFTGIGEAGYAPAGNSLVGDFFREDARAKVMSWLSVAGLIGPIMGMVLGGVIAGLAPSAWRWAFLVTGIPGLVLAFFAWRLREPARRQTIKLSYDGEAGASNGVKATDILVHMRAVLRIKPLACLVIYGVLTAFTATALQVYFPTLLQQHDTFGLTSGQAALYAGLALGPIGLTGVISGGYLAGWLSRRYQGANMLICVVSVMLVAPLNVVSLLLINTHNLVLFSAVLIPTFLINTLHFGPLSAAVLDVAPEEMRASAVAIFVFLQRLLGTAMAPLLIGTLAGIFDPSGLHFLHNVAGHDLVLALVSSCPIAYLGAGLVGMIGLRLIRRERKAGDAELA